MNKIPLSVSSTLVAAADAPAIQVSSYANMTGKTGSAAPVLIAVESVGTIDAATFAEALPAKGGQGTASQARLVVNAMAAVLEDLVAEYGAISVATPLGRIETFVSGSLEYATDTVDPELNKAFLGVIPGADVMKTFAQLETYVPTATCPASLKRIRDVATGDSAIYGTSPFYAQGYGMTYGGTGETVKLLHPLTRAVVCNVSVDAATKSQAQLKCTLQNSAAIAAGTYILQVTTLAGGIGTLWPLELKVNLAQAVEPPALFVDTSAGVTIKAVKPQTGTVLKAGETFNMTGLGLQQPGTDKGGINAMTWSYGDQEGTCTMTYAADGKSGTLKLNSTDALAAGTYNVTVAVATRTPEDEPGEGGEFTLSVKKE